eukprot:TRINITY_DN6999_c0_g4_i2.p1 TRINITY_DN6999_c0_g4~~TRINITY_DN6999_c0_g4_i2.p1  ORF type:complete len:499 (-),score=51.22 TRINITY_DN6999_c0_g4_i2:107-1603(-)
MDRLVRKGNTAPELSRSTSSSRMSAFVRVVPCFSATSSSGSSPQACDPFASIFADTHLRGSGSPSASSADSPHHCPSPSKPSADLLPGLPDDLAILCLARVPLRWVAGIRPVCTSWRSVLDPGNAVELQRKAMGVAEHWIAMIRVGKHRLVDGMLGGGLVRTHIGGSGSFRECSIHDAYRSPPSLPPWHTSPSSELRTKLLFFDFSDKEWVERDVPDEVQNVVYFRGVTMGVHLYLFGGREEGLKEEAVSRKKAWRYNVALNSWKRLADINVARENFQFGVVNGTIVVVGGESGFWSPVNSYEIYDPEKDLWKLVQGREIDTRGWRRDFAVGVGKSLYTYPDVLMVCPRQELVKHFGNTLFEERWIDALRSATEIRQTAGCDWASLEAICFHPGRLLAVLVKYTSDWDGRGKFRYYEVRVLLGDQWVASPIVFRRDYTPDDQLFQLVSIGDRLYVVGRKGEVVEVKWDRGECITIKHIVEREELGTLGSYFLVLGLLV